MNETNKFKDVCGEWVQAQSDDKGDIVINNYGAPWLTPDQAIEFAKQLTELAQEVKAKQ